MVSQQVHDHFNASLHCLHDLLCNLYGSLCMTVSFVGNVGWSLCAFCQECHRSSWTFLIWTTVLCLRWLFLPVQTSGSCGWEMWWLWQMFRLGGSQRCCIQRISPLRLAQISLWIPSSLCKGSPWDETLMSVGEQYTASCWHGFGTHSSFGSLL